MCTSYKLRIYKGPCYEDTNIAKKYNFNYKNQGTQATLKYDLQDL